MGDFEDLKVWRDSVELAEQMLRLVERLPVRVRFTLGDQIGRAAISVPSNIAEGVGRQSDRELARFLRYSLGSLYELQTQVVIATRMGYFDSERDHVMPSIRAVRRMLHGLLGALNLD